MSRSLVLVSWLLASLVVISPARRAAAQTADEALADEGYALREQGKDGEALAKFRQAEALRPLPRYLAQVALAEQALGRWTEAYEHLKRAMSAEDDAWINSRGEPLRAALATIEAELGQLEIQCNVSGATVRVSGREAGVTPLQEPLQVAAGSVAVEVAAPGYVSVTQVITVHRGALSRAELALVPEANTASSTRGAEAAVAALAAAAPPASAHSRRHDLRWLYGVGTGAAIVLGGALTSVMSAKQVAQANDACVDSDDVRICSDSDWDANHDQVQRLDRASYALFGTGAAVALASLGMLAWKKPAERRVAWSIDVTRARALGYAQVRF